MPEYQTWHCQRLKSKYSVSVKWEKNWKENLSWTGNHVWCRYGNKNSVNPIPLLITYRSLMNSHWAVIDSALRVTTIYQLHYSNWTSENLSSISWFQSLVWHHHGQTKSNHRVYKRQLWCFISLLTITKFHAPENCDKEWAAKCLNLIKTSAQTWKMPKKRV